MSVFIDNTNWTVLGLSHNGKTLDLSRVSTLSIKVGDWIDVRGGKYRMTDGRYINEGQVKEFANVGKGGIIVKIDARRVDKRTSSVRGVNYGEQWINARDILDRFG